MRRRVLVTGANGFVGRTVCAAMARNNWEVRAAVRDGRAAATLPFPSACVGDVGRQTDWITPLEGIDVVVHLAARTHVLDDHASNPLDSYRRINVDGSLRLAQQAVQQGVARIVFLSSVKVNGERTDTKPFTEADLPRPEDPYGISKWEAEQALAAVCGGSTALTVLRPPLVYGPGAKGNLLALMRAIERGWPLPLAAVHNRRTLIGLDNLVGAIGLAATHPSAIGATFLLGDDEPVSAPALAREIARAMGRKARLLHVPVSLMRAAGALLGRRPAIERLTSSLEIDSSEIRQRLGWHMVGTFEQGIHDMVASRSRAR